MKLFVILGLIAVASAHFQYQQEWEDWTAQFQKTYSSDEVALSRQIIWESNKVFVDNHNMNADKYGFIVEMNEFADLDPAEFSNIYNGLLPRSASYNATKVFVHNGQAVPSTVDWRDKGVVSEVKNQGQCGSCWSFATTGSLEGQHAIKTGKLVSLSEQQLVDCSTTFGNHGCQGGLMDFAYKYIASVKGDDTEKSYPYTAENGRCHYNPDNVGAGDKSYTDIPREDEDALMKAVGTVGPISVAIDASHRSFQLYKQGVYYEPLCSEIRLDHGVLAVGYGTEGGKDYWLVKNSWGSSWGMKGYLMMSRNKKNNCGIATQASYPTGVN